MLLFFTSARWPPRCRRAPFCFLTAAHPPPQLEWVGTYDSYTYDDDAAEKVAWDAIQQVAVVTNANEGYARRSAGRSTDAHAEPATDLPYAPVQPRRYYRPL